MARSFYIILFCSLLVCFFSLFSYRIQINTEYGIQSTEYENHLTRACQASVSSQEVMNDLSGTYLYNTDFKREKAINLFFSTLERGFNYVNDSNKANELTYHVPVLCLIDSDGYYILYNAPYTSDDGSLMVSSVLTPINTWGTTAKNDQYLIRYFLSDYVEVTQLETGQAKKGVFQSVYEYFGKPESLEALSSREEFENHKIDTIITEINEKVELYINQYNYSVNRLEDDGVRSDYDIHYTFELPQIKYEDWCNLIDAPSTLAFLQGNQINNGNNNLNIYSMAGGEMIKRNGCYMQKRNEEYIYHRAGCSMLSTDIDSDYGLTKEECAKQGYYPCRECNP